MTATPTFKTVRLVVRDGAAYLILNRPEALNAINYQLIEEFEAALDYLASDRSVKALVISGEGRAFSVGADINVIESGLANPRELRRFLETLNAMLQRIEALDLPTIAAVNGLTRAGGFELLLACDIAIASEEAKIGDYHTPYGAMPGGGATQRAPRRFGPQRAFELIYTGRWLTGKEAEEYGIVLKTVPSTVLPEAIEDLVRQLKDKSRDCLGYIKRAMREGLDRPLGEGLRLEVDLLMEYLDSSPDFREGVSAYREGRPPRFSVQEGS